LPNSPLAGIKVCVFDAYGTLFDVAAAARACRDVLGDVTGPVSALWRDKQLQYTWLRAAQDRHADFWQVTGDALDFTLETFGLGGFGDGADEHGGSSRGGSGGASSRDGLRDRLMALYLALEAYPEVPAMLTALRHADLVTAILSNGTPKMLAAAVAAARLELMFDAVLSVEEVGVFKPARRVYQLAVDKLGCPAGAIAFVSSNAWDVHAASAFGMRVVWCNRHGARRERLPGAPDCEIATLRELPPLVGADP
jgi:2-haloacid dehalogenase